VRELEKALAIKHNDSAAQLNLAMVYEQTGSYEKAIPLFAKLETAAPATLYLNQKDGTFRDIAIEAGAAYVPAAESPSACSSSVATPAWVVSGAPNGR
jgi:tetratricopeptide (TPR) repeat protein